MENKMEHEIENGQLIISFYGEIDGYNVASVSYTHLLHLQI